ncbi:MAG: carbon-nitrogen hydrolase family protein [Bacteroidia bacterium]
MRSLKIAIVQKSPVFFNLKKCLDLAIASIEEAADNNCKLITFGETWLSGYPAFLDFCPEVGYWDSKNMKKVFANIYKNSVEIESKTTDMLCEKAKKHGISLVMGINEIAKKPIGTIFNSILTINEKGQIANVHRKLMPTFTEKLVYGIGDGAGLNAVKASWGKFGSLVCWEHWMPLTRQAMHIEGEDLHIACWPSVHEKHQIASRQYAFEGRCFVIAVGQMMKKGQIPTELKLPPNTNPNEWLLNGGSCVIAPNGEYLLEPQFNQEKMIYYTIEDLDKVIEERMTLDVTGHYNRNDVFEFNINKKRL